MIIVGIAGGSGAGKTTVARTIAERFSKENVNYLSQDWYYKDLSDIPQEELEKKNLDHPGAFDNELLLTHLKSLKEGQCIEVPSYDFNTHARIEKTMNMQPRAVLILEGILILAIEKVRSIIDLKIFVDADPDIRLIRRLERDIKERGSSFDETIERYLSTVKPMHEAFVEPSKMYADIIVPRGGANEIATVVLADLVEHYVIDHQNGDLLPNHISSNFRKLINEKSENQSKDD